MSTNAIDSEKPAPATPERLPAKVKGARKSKRRRTMSAAGRKAIADAARKRWGAIKAGKAPSLFSKKQ